MSRLVLHNVLLHPAPRSASLTHRPILLPAVFTLGLSRKAFPGSRDSHEASSVLPPRGILVE